MAKITPMKKRLMKTLAETISKQVWHFNLAEVECLIHEFNAHMGEMTTHGRAVAGLERGKFRSILHNIFGITDDTMMDRVFRTFDKDNDSFISTKEWVEGLSVFLRGTLDDKIKYCFFVYDLNGDNYISREEMFPMLKDCLVRLPIEEDPDEGIKDIVDMTFKKMDHDRDGRLSYADFERSVKENNLLLEAFGTCLPDHMKIEKFEQHVFHEHVE